MQKRLDGVHTLYDKASYDEAKAVLSIVKELNAKIDRAFDSEIEKAEYGLYLSWAKYHEGRKEWSKAQTRISTALSIQKGGEALALQKRIASAADAEERGATLETGLKNLDAYIARGDLIRAQRLLVSLTKTASDASGRKALDQRRKIMIDSLSGIYASALKAYREERFKDAIGLFETVVAVDSSFEDASGYLEKARTEAEASGSVLMPHSKDSMENKVVIATLKSYIPAWIRTTPSSRLGYFMPLVFGVQSPFLW
ncbi:hypothetical protein MASR2M48_21900 [Spirochaetota bacterium]